jgi:hypothetical protein
LMADPEPTNFFHSLIAVFQTGFET